jgi:poly-gamma-glutamate synthesis protein (capsule biosynthesis protein)
MDIYDAHGMLYFGGGRDLESSFQPALITDHGNKLAFLGCNYAGPVSDWATDSQPGSTPCDFDRLGNEIAILRSEGYLPIMTFQFYEYNQATPGDDEQVYFRRMAEAGAVIVSGSQSHFPALMEFYGGSFIHYGLGNLFFDQMFRSELRMEFIDRHIFYDGRYLGTELLTYELEDYSRPRPMTPAERRDFLSFIFDAAGWLPH